MLYYTGAKVTVHFHTVYDDAGLRCFFCFCRRPFRVHSHYKATHPLLDPVLMPHVVQADVYCGGGADHQ